MSVSRSTGIQAASNGAPTASPDSASLTQRLTATGNLLANDDDPDDDTLTVVSVAAGAGSPVPLSGAPVVIAGLYGTLTLSADGSYSYAADREGALAVGEVQTDSFTYTVSDGQGGESSAAFRASVTGSGLGTAGDNFFRLTVSSSNALATGFGGNDTYVIDNAGDRVVEAAGRGTADRVNAWVSYILAASQEIEILGTTKRAATNAIDLTGNEVAQTIYGNNGANTLDGRGGADTLQGFGGNDTYVVDHAGDRVLEAYGDGEADRVNASVSYVLAARQEIETLATTNAAGTDAINLTGNGITRTIYGNAGDNVLMGGYTLIGLGGDDTYVGGNRVLEAAHAGTDRVNIAAGSYVLEGGQEIEILGTTRRDGTTAISLTGNEFAQTIYGNNGNNTLNGGGGADTLQGFFGNDTYFVDNVGDRILEAGGIQDLVRSSVSYTLAAGVGIELLATPNAGGTAAINLTGNELRQVIYGNSGDNVLTTGGGYDTLQGFGGKDIFWLTSSRPGSVPFVTPIEDFSPANDTIRLNKTNFPALDVGTLAASAFKRDAYDAVVDADDRIILDSSHGSIFYDPDGGSADRRIVFCNVGPNNVLTHEDFVIVA